MTTDHRRVRHNAEGQGKLDEKLINAVEKGHVSDATTALAEGADPNCLCCHGSLHHNDTPTHIAAKNGNTTLMKLLIVFDADVNMKNQKGETPLEVAHPACREIITKVLKMRQNLETRDLKTAKPPPKLDDDDVFLLSLDGGGIRGLVFVQVAIELDKRREQLYPGSKPFLSYFNWIAGNSTGGISALAVAIGRDAIYGRQIYFKLKDEIFKGNPPYANDQVNRVMQTIFGEENIMSDIKEYNVAVMTTLVNTNPPKLHIMRTYGGIPDDGQVGPDKRRIWEAARATSTAVPYFHPFGDFIDGGFIANNPTVDALVDIQSHFKKQQRKVNVKAVISLGCGDVTQPLLIDKPDKANCNPEVTRDTIGFHPMSKKFSQITLASESGEVVKDDEAFAKAIGAKYHRVNPKIEKVDFTETDDEKLIEMLYSTVLYMLENYTEKMDKILESIMEY